MEVGCKILVAERSFLFFGEAYFFFFLQGKLRETLVYCILFFKYRIFSFAKKKKGIECFKGKKKSCKGSALTVSCIVSPI